MAKDVNRTQLSNAPDDLLNALLKDLGATYNPPGTDDDATPQFWRRTYIRTLFAMIEGATWLHKQYALRLHEHGRVEFTTGELALLRDVQFDFQNGKVREQPRFLNVADNFRFGFYALNNVMKSGHVLDVTGEPWERFKKAIEIRNRITHPKSTADILVTRDEHVEMLAVGAWTIAELFMINVDLYKWMEKNGVPPEEVRDASAGTV
jgi:hypothetical protein